MSRATTRGATMADINVEHFYKDAAKVFSILYSTFPNRTAVYVDDVAGVDVPDEYGLHSPRYTSGFFAILWLADEGLIRYVETIREDGVDQAALTIKAFLKLSAVAPPLYDDPPDDDSEGQEESPPMQFPPSVLEDRMVVINQLRRALRMGSSIALGKVIQHILA